MPITTHLAPALSGREALNISDPWALTILIGADQLAHGYSLLVP